ncbi:uncharacterized protein LOC120289849 [Eucalyptus grandis]|uniref:uncharacterized protein LOC120289849 n=1 Tax=Eucalyptus grandis TaxID=71139 RepID=UPI00192EB8CF|nr:uncharacterized protein LOC120289849 [Eucalyptus grandis]
MASPSWVPDHPKRDAPRQHPPAATLDHLLPSAPCQPLHLESQPVMGYPSTIGFPHPYHKPLPPLQPSPDPTGRFAGPGFACGMLEVLVMFAVLLCTINIIFNVVMRPKPPVFTVDSLSVSDFNVLGSVLMANWETSVAVDNPDSRLEVRFDEIRCFLCYGDPQYYLAWTTREPFSVGTKGRGKIYLRMAISRRRGGRCKIWALN